MLFHCSSLDFSYLINRNFTSGSHLPLTAFARVIKSFSENPIRTGTISLSANFPAGGCHDVFSTTSSTVLILVRLGSSYR